MTQSAADEVYVKEQIHDWLRTKPSSTWGQYSITKDDERQHAVDWFYQQMTSFMWFAIGLPQPPEDDG